MKANFALSLSFEGIRLFYRASDGWRRVDEVDLTVSDLSAELEALKAAALACDPTGLRTKLIIPADQIKYLSIETGEVEEVDRRIAARKALDGATPYEVGDLAFDVVADGVTTHIAAVALETLEEAETFALQHGFDPISCVGVPGDETFPGEPFFGATVSAARLLGEGERVEPDHAVLVVVGDIGDQPKLSLEEIENAPDLDDPAPEAPVDAEPEVSMPGFSSRRARSELGGVSQDGIAPVAGDVPVAAMHAQPAPDITSPSLPIEEPGFTTVGDPEEVRARFNPLPETSEPVHSPAPEPVAMSGGAAVMAQPDERAQMTIFGAREGAIGGKPRFLGLILTSLLLLFLVGVAAWARVYFEEEIARLFAPRSAPEPQFVVTVDDSTPEPEAEDTVVRAAPSDSFVSEAQVQAALSREPEFEDGPAARAPADTATSPQPFSDSQARTFYARTGIWTISPKMPNSPDAGSLESLYVTSIDRKGAIFDAVALADPSEFLQDELIRAEPNPQPPEVKFAFDARGLLIATPEGAIAPDGYRVFAGKPPVFPASIPNRVAEAPVLVDEVSLALAAIRPVARPDGLVENTERVALGGLSRSELAEIRPRVRPETLVAAVVVEPEPEPEPTPEPQQEIATTSNADIERAIGAALRPAARPRNFERIVARATPRTPAPSTEADQEERVAAVAPRTVTPSIPSSTSVAKQATVRNVLNLNRINLLGVSGTPSKRSALVRLSNGRIKKVKVGDRIDGGRVSAISDGELRYRKGNRNIVLKMPRT